MLQVNTNNELLLNHQPTGLRVTQAPDRTVVQQDNVEVMLTYPRYSLAHAKPASGVPGVDQLENEIIDYLTGPVADAYSVEADRETGLWVTEPRFTGKTSLKAWHTREDTDNVHYDTFELDDKTCAIEVHWQD